MRGELEASRQDAIMWQRLAEDQKDLRLRVMGHRIRGQSEFLLGDIASARTNLELGLALFLSLLIVRITQHLPRRMGAS